MSDMGVTFMKELGLKCLRNVTLSKLLIPVFNSASVILPCYTSPTSCHLKASIEVTKNNIMSFPPKCCPLKRIIQIILQILK